MPEAPVRKLAAILAADIVGYSSLIERDEAGTVARLKSDREELIDPTIAGHGGRIVRLAGDGALVEFPSVVEATQCAIDVQRGIPARNADRAEDQQIIFRIGVNLGDIIVEDDNLHGEGWDDTREEALQKGIELAERGIEIDPEEPVNYIQLAHLSALMGEHDRAVAHAEQAATLGSNDYQSTGALAVQLVWAGEQERAIELFSRVDRLSPRYPAWVDWMRGLAQLMAGQKDEAITTLQRAVDRSPKSVWPRGRLVAAYMEADRHDKAKAEAVELPKIHPDFEISLYVNRHPFKDPGRKQWLRELLLKAGLPEGKSS